MVGRPPRAAAGPLAGFFQHPSEGPKAGPGCTPSLTVASYQSQPLAGEPGAPDD